MTAPPASTLVEIYGQYLAAFNSQDLDRVAEFLTPDMVFEWGGVMPDFTSRQEFMGFYRLAWSHFDESIVARVTAVNDDTLSAWIDNTLTIHVDWPDSPIQPFRAGERLEVSGYVHYRFIGSRIAHIAQDG